MERLPRSISVLLIGLLTASINLSTTACRPQETDLPFETLEQRDSSGSGIVYEDKQPGLAIVTKPDEAANLNELITSEAQTQLQSLDYNQHFAIAAFQGWKQSTRYGVQIERITRSGDIVTVYAIFQEPRPDEAKGAAVTSPYHVVKVQKVGTWGGTITFKLVVADATTASLSHDVP